VRLADFISQHLEPILVEWVAFAQECGPAGRVMDRVQLRDHAEAMLRDIVADLRTSQSPAEEIAKSKGETVPDASVGDTAAEVHGAGRAESGFTMREMVAEYRALRASVLRFWTAETGTLTGADIEDLMRFNEAIDQALSESVSRFAEDLDRSREMFVAILGHDLRQPLNTILMASQFLLETPSLAEPQTTMAARIVRSAERMNAMADDLLDFAQGRLGAGMPIFRQPMDLAQETGHAIDEIRVAHPLQTVILESNGDLHGEWDGARLRQLLSNLLGNATQYGARNGEIHVTLSGSEDRVTLAVHNTGTPIPSAQVHQLFDPFKRLASSGTERRKGTGVGLGLYIAEQIVHAHEGTIVVTSTQSDGTVFTVSLPRTGSVGAERALATPETQRIDQSTPMHTQEAGRPRPVHRRPTPPTNVAEVC